MRLPAALAVLLLVPAPAALANASHTTTTHHATPHAASAATHAAPTGLKGVDAAWVKAMKANDAAATSALYAQDAVAWFPNEPEAKGAAAIRASWDSFFKANTVTDVTLQSLGTHTLGTTAVGWGTFSLSLTPKAGGAPMEAIGRYTEVGRLTNGHWLYLVDHASFEPPPAAPAPAAAPAATPVVSAPKPAAPARPAPASKPAAPRQSAKPTR